MIHEIESRKSIRKYTGDAVSEEEIIRMIDAARLAPSGNNSQPWRFMVIRNEELKAQIAEIDHAQGWMLSAPVYIACLGDTRVRGNAAPEEYCAAEDSPQASLKLIIRDTSIAVGYMLLEAERIGLGTCWTGWYEQKKMRKVLDIPDYYYVCGILTVGHPAEAPAPKPRHSVNELILRSI